jgi:hypothetical protein
MHSIDSMSAGERQELRDYLDDMEGVQHGTLL